MCCVVRELNPARYTPCVGGLAVKLEITDDVYPCLGGGEYLLSDCSKHSEQLQKGVTACQPVQ